MNATLLPLFNVCCVLLLLISIQCKAALRVDLDFNSNEDFLSNNGLTSSSDEMNINSQSSVDEPSLAQINMLRQPSSASNAAAVSPVQPLQPLQFHLQNPVDFQRLALFKAKAKQQCKATLTIQLSYNSIQFLQTVTPSATQRHSAVVEFIQQHLQHYEEQIGQKQLKYELSVRSELMEKGTQRVGKHFRHSLSSLFINEFKVSDSQLKQLLDHPSQFSFEPFDCPIEDENSKLMLKLQLIAMPTGLRKYVTAETVVLTTQQLPVVVMWINTQTLNNQNNNYNNNAHSSQTSLSLAKHSTSSTDIQTQYTQTTIVHPSSSSHHAQPVARNSKLNANAEDYVSQRSQQSSNGFNVESLVTRQHSPNSIIRTQLQPQTSSSSSSQPSIHSSHSTHSQLSDSQFEHDFEVVQHDNVVLHHNQQHTEDEDEWQLIHRHDVQHM